ncbi:MAG: hypothetical protein ABMA13_19060 [Chthoniobacteraceae bacterium]
MQSDFVAVSVAAGNMHRPAAGLENELLRAIGKSGPAPQGIAVLNADGQVLDWVLMFDDDASVLKFLDHARQRFAVHPDNSAPFMTERYQRFPGSKRDDVAAHTVTVPKGGGHDDTVRCPADSIYEPGTLIAKVAGRRVIEEGRLTGDTVNQEDYSQDRFVITPGTQRQLLEAVNKADGKRVRVPDQVARQWVTYAYMGMLDVNPFNNPAGATSDHKDVAFDIETAGGHPGWYRITGESHGSVKTERRQGDGAGFENDVQLTWRGFARIENDRLVSLLLRGDGDERLMWNPGGLPGAIGRGPEVANLPAGRHVDWKGPVSFSIIGTPAKAEQTSPTAAGAAAPEDRHREIQAKIPQLRDHMEKGGARVMQTVAPLMQEFQKLMREQRFDEASKQLDKILGQLDAASAVPEKAAAPPKPSTN